MNDTVVIGGEVSLINVIDGEEGIFFPVSDIQNYEGDYTITPSMIQQVIPTEGKRATENFIINPISLSIWAGGEY